MGSNQTEWAAEFQKKYAGAYKHYMKNNEQAPPCYAAAECKTVADLEAWETHQKKQIQTYVPEAYRQGADAAVDKEFETNRMRVLNITSNSTSNSSADSHAQAKDAASDAKDSSSSSWPFELAAASNSAQATVQSDASGQPQQLPEQAPSRIPAILGATIILTAIGAFVATRQRKDRSELEGYTDLEGQP